MANESASEGYCPNAYSGRVFLSRSQTLALNVTFISLSPVTIIANAIVIYRITKSKLHHNVSNFLILAMSIADFLTGAVTVPCVYTLYSKYAQTRFCAFELVTQFISTTLVYVSITMIMLIAIDRLIHQKFTSRCGITLSNRSARCFTFTAVMISVALCAMLTMSSIFNRIRTISLVFSIIVILIITVVFASYIRTYVHISKFVRNSIVWNGGGPLPRRPRRRRGPKYLRQFCTTVLFIILGICFCYLPFVILIFVAFFANDESDCVMNCNVDKEWLRIAFFISYALIYSNSSLNALIILLRNRNIARYEQNQRKSNAIAPVTPARRCSAVTGM